MKRGLKITVWILGLLAILLLAALVAIQSPAVQTFLGKRFVEHFQKGTDAVIQFENISIRPTEAILLENLVVLDKCPKVEGADTLMYVDNLSVKFSLRGLLQGKSAYISRLRLHGGGLNLVTELDPTDLINHSNINLMRVFHLSGGEEKEESKWGNLLTAREVEIEDFAFSLTTMRDGVYKTFKEPVSEGVIDWDRLSVVLERGTFSQVKVANNHILAQNPVLQIYEKETGWHVQEVSAQSVDVGEKLVHIEALHIADGFSDIHMEHLDLEGSIDDYDDFENKVVLDGLIQDGSLVDMGGTITHLTSLNSTFRGYPRGHVRGTVNNLSLDNITVLDADNGLRFNVAGTIRDVIEIEDSRLDLKIREISFDMNGLAGFVHAWAPETELDLREIARGERLKFEGTLTGLLNDLRVNGQVHSDLGGVLADVYIKNAVNDKDINLGGHVATSDLHLGRLLGTESLGPLSMRTTLDAVFRDGGGMDVELDTLQIRRLQALEYDYTGISAKGTYKNESLKATLVANDPNLQLNFGGQLDLGGQKDALYRFKLDLQKADLVAMNLQERGKSVLSLQVDSDILRTDPENLGGQVTVSGIRLEDEEGLDTLGDIVIEASQVGDRHSVVAHSEVLELSFLGSRHIKHFVEDISNLAVSGELPALVGEPSAPWSGASYEVSAQLLNAQDLLDFLVPGLYIENKTTLTLKALPEGDLTANVTSGRLALNDRYIKDFHLDARNSGSALSADITGATLELGGRQLLNNLVKLRADDNHVELGYVFDNKGDGKTYGDLKVQADLSMEDEELAVKAKVLPSLFSFTSNEWHLSSEDIEYRAGDLRVSQLRAAHEEQSLLIDGGLCEGKADTLRVSMDQFDLALLNSLTGGTPDLQGLASGRAMVVSPYKPAMGLLAGITCDSVYVAHRPMGTVHLVSNYDESSQRFTATMRNMLDGHSSLDASAFLVPDTREVGALLIMDKLDMGYAEPFLNSLFSEFRGSLNGLVSLDGTLDKVHLGSERLRVEDGALTLDFTQVPYAVEGDLELTDEGLFFKPLHMSDRDQGKGTIEGGLLFNDFKNIGVDVHVNFQQMHALNMAPSEDAAFFGNLHGDGRVDVSGTLSKIQLDIEATTRSGEVHIPLGSMSGDRSSEMLTFTNGAPADEDPYEAMVRKRRKVVHKQELELNVQVRVHATPAAQVYIDIDKESSLTGSGQGIIDIVSRSRQDIFTLNGEYRLNGGNFHFSAMHLVSRDFAIQEGSSLRFNGDVMNTDLNVEGLYVTKASLYNLTADESASSRRTVNCGINITGKLRNPELHFTIDIPDLNPTVQARVQGAFNTEDKVQTQFIYLLVAGNFLPSEDSGISVGGSDVLFSNVSSIMSGQLNNIFQKLNIPLDLGLNYKNTQAGSNIFDVAVSTQLFNNRVVVNGTVGNREKLGGTSTNQVAGDVDIEIKLNRSGSLRLSLFTHSADQLSAFLDNSQRHGGGIAYQMEFNTFKQLLRDLFSNRKKREERAREDALNPAKNVIMTIDQNGKAHVQR